MVMLFLSQKMGKCFKEHWWDKRKDYQKKFDSCKQKVDETLDLVNMVEILKKSEEQILYKNSLDVVENKKPSKNYKFESEE